MGSCYRLAISAAIVGTGILTCSVPDLPQASAAEPAKANAEIAVKVRFISVSEGCWELLSPHNYPSFFDLGMKFTYLNDGGHKRPVALLSEKQTFSLMEGIQGDRRNGVLLAPRLTVGNCQQASLEIAGDVDSTRGTVLPWDQKAKADGGVERGVAGVQLTVRPVVGDGRADSVTLKARLIRNTEGFCGRPKESRFLGDPVNVTVSVPKHGAALVGGWKVERQVERRTRLPVVGKISSQFSRVSQEREVDMILILVTARRLKQAPESVGLGLPPGIAAGH